MYYLERIDDDCKPDNPHDIRQHRLFEERGDVWGGKEQYEVTDCRDGNVEIENGREIYFRPVLLPDEGVSETAVHERLRHGKEYRHHLYDTIIGRKQQPRHYHSKQELDALVCVGFNGAPFHTGYGILFYALGHVVLIRPSFGDDVRVRIKIGHGLGYFYGYIVGHVW